MQKEFFNLSDEAFLYLVEIGISDITNWGWQFAETHSSVTLRFVRGNKMKTVETLFDEFSAALQFPYYFGENWGAFDECIADLDWLPGETNIIVTTNSDQLFKEELLDELNILIDCFKRAGTDFKQENKGFFVVFQYNENKRDFKSKLNSITTDFQEIHL
jgi:RNAse (barnase) inhibitor barstar